MGVGGLLYADAKEEDSMWNHLSENMLLQEQRKKKNIKFAYKVRRPFWNSSFKLEFTSDPTFSQRN